jgi:phage terminase large subunit
VDNDSNFFIADEHYETGQTIDYHAGRINSRTLSTRVSQTYGDPSGAQWITEFSQRGIYITPANKETGTNVNTWVRYGIEKIAEKLKQVPGHIVSKTIGTASLYVFNNCTNTIKEFENYRWKEKSNTQAKDLNEPDVPDKANDHAMDALRYFVVSYMKHDTFIPVNKKNWQIA